MPMLKGYHKDARALFAGMTAKRLLNLILLYASHAFSKLLKRNLHAGKPAFLTLEVTNSCNLSCPECVTGMNGLKRPTSWMSETLAIQTLDKTRNHAWVANLYFQGEPLLNPELVHIISATTNAKIYSVVSTNAQNLTVEKAEQLVKSGLKKLVVSMDGNTQETYSKYRVRGKLQKVLDGISNLTEARKKYKSAFPVIEVQFIVFRFNENEIKAARKNVSDRGCDRFVLKTAQFYDAKRAGDWMPVNKKHGRYASAGSLRTKTGASHGCKKMWTTMVVCSGGEVALCCMDKNAVYSPGNLKGSVPSDVWQNDSMDQFRGSIIKGDYYSICKNCPLKG